MKSGVNRGIAIVVTVVAIAVIAIAVVYPRQKVEPIKQSVVKPTPAPTDVKLSPAAQQAVDSANNTQPKKPTTTYNSGHEAGYNWGEQHDICDTKYDNGNSESFNEGVRQYAEENCSSIEEEED